MFIMPPSRCISLFLTRFPLIIRLASMGKTLSYNFETVRNVDMAATELGSVKESMRAWNLSVQYWLASCIYSRFKGPRSVRQVPYEIVSGIYS